MSGETSASESGWTVDTWAAHERALREGDIRLAEALREADRSFAEERDRRYTEVNIEKEKALKIKETADLAALSLARDIQIYKDEKANELREQINSERGNYATKDDLIASSARLEALIRPLLDYRQLDIGRNDQRIDTRTVLLSVIGLIIALALAVGPHLH